MVTVKIAAQPLESALDAFAMQTGLQVVYSSVGRIRNLPSPGFVGTLRVDQILKRMLAPSGLVYGFINSHTVVVRPRTVAPAPPTNAAAVVPPLPISVESHVAPGEASKAADAKSAKMLDTVTVIGTNLRDIASAAPVQIIDAETIKNRGYSSIEDVLRHLPMNFSNTSSTSVALGEEVYGERLGAHLQSTLGASAVNLLGLGSRSTLVLVDGHRRTGSAQAQGEFTDISSIPLSQIERIEVLGAGASAIYGADAVGGVINIVLKKSYEGTVIHTRHENSASGADVNEVDLAHTFGWKNGALTVSAQYRSADPPNIRRYIHVGPSGIGDFTDIGGANVRTSNLGQPGVVFESIDGGYPGGHLEGAPLGIIPGGQSGSALQPSQLLPYSIATAPSDYPIARIGPQVKSPAFRVSGEQTFGDELKLSYGVGYTQQRDVEHWHPSAGDFNFLEGGGAEATYIPASNPYNHFGQDVLVGYSYDREFAGMTLSQDQKQTNRDYNLGLSGKLPVLKNWTFDLNYNGSMENGRTDALGDLDGSGGPDGYGRTMGVLDGLNVFGDGSDPAVVASNRALLETLVERYAFGFRSSEDSVDLLTRGALFALPAGKVEAAIGAQYNSQRYHYQSTIDGFSVSDSHRDDTAEFVELGVPLLKDLPLAKELTLTLAARHGSFNEHGNGSLQNYAPDLVALGGFDLQSLTGTVPSTAQFGQTVNPQGVVTRYSNTSDQFGLVWKPVESLRLRTTWGKSFLTPSVQQLFGPITSSDATFLVNYDGAQLPAGYTQLVELDGPNPNLKPQIATVKTIGFDYSPAFATGGLTVSSTYNETDFKNYIGAPLADLTYAQLFADIDELPPGVFVKGKNGVLLFDGREVNFIGRKSRSIDTNVSDYFTNRLGVWNVQLDAVRTLGLVVQPLPGIPATVISDSEFGPSKWVADMSLTWDEGNYNGTDYFASAGAHYSSAHRVLQPLSSYPSSFNNYIPNPDPRRRSPSYTTVDFQVGVRWANPHSWLSGSTIRLGVQDAFDRAFPFVDNNVGFISNRVDVRGRVIYLDLKKEF
ncbi:TonB-dependent receptor domain-containing protein [Rhodanobacter terrae]|uniref:TonB-dependent receptor domain-containing protein n=1 Tax=Rhodanobacter terrae TaxID=418647 RepID=A0ABW0SVA4_9GAMM